MPAAFFTAVEDTAVGALSQGLSGWPVPDAKLIMTHSGYAPRQSHAHAKFDKSMSSTGSDFRFLTALVAAEALRAAGHGGLRADPRYRIEAPADCLSGLLDVLGRLASIGGSVRDRTAGGDHRRGGGRLGCPRSGDGSPGSAMARGWWRAASSGSSRFATQWRHAGTATGPTRWSAGTTCWRPPAGHPGELRCTIVPKGPRRAPGHLRKVGLRHRHADKRCRWRPLSGDWHRRNRGRVVQPQLEETASWRLPAA